MSDKEIILGCLKGDLDTQRVLFDKYAGSMKVLCLRYLGNEQDAEDVLQEGFLLAFTKLKDYSFKGSFGGWLRRIMINLSLQHINKNKRMIFDDIDSTSNFFRDDPQVLERLMEDDLMMLLSKLPVGYRTVFNLHVIEGYSHKEIAEILKIETSTSRSQLTKAKQRLRKIIRENYL